MGLLNKIKKDNEIGTWFIDPLRYVLANKKPIWTFTSLLLATVAFFLLLAISIALYATNELSLFLTVIVSFSSGIVLFLCISASQGYVIKVIRSASSEETELPQFELFSTWATLISDGISMLLISLIYTAVPLILAGILFFSSFPLSKLISILLEESWELNQTGASVDFLVNAFLAFMLISLIISIFSYYVTPAPILVYANEGQFKLAFSWKKISSILFNYVYFIRSLQVLAVIFIAAVITAIVGAIPIFGLILSIIIGVIASLMVWHMWGKIYNSIN